MGLKYEFNMETTFLCVLHNVVLAYGPSGKQALADHAFNHYFSEQSERIHFFLHVCLDLQYM